MRPPEALYTHLLKSRSFEGVLGSLGKSQKEGQGEQGTLKQLGGSLLALLLISGPGLPSGAPPCLLTSLLTIDPGLSNASRARIHKDCSSRESTVKIGTL